MSGAGADNRRVVLVRKPRGPPQPDDFDVVPAPLPAGPGVLADVLYVSLDPYLRGRLSGRHIAGPIAAGDAMDSELVRLRTGRRAGRCERERRIVTGHPTLMDAS